MMQGLRRAREKRAGRPITFAVHGGGGDWRVFDAMVPLPGHLAEPIRTRAEASGHGEEEGAAAAVQSEFDVVPTSVA